MNLLKVVHPDARKDLNGLDFVLRYIRGEWYLTKLISDF